MENLQKYKKKVEVVDEHSTPEARGQRLKRLRNLANLSRKEMCDNDFLNVNTLKGWEIARYGGLPLDGARKVIKRVAKEGVQCTINWLLYGTGPSPQIAMAGKPNNHQLDVISKEDVFDEDQMIRNELNYFHNHFPNAIDYQVQDDGMSPIYKKGEYLAGIKRVGDDISSIVSRDCIVHLANGEILCRHLRQGNQENRYHLICLNSNTTVKLPVIYDVELISAAPVIWHRRKDQLNEG